jgi:hypothetical protein
LGDFWTPNAIYVGLKPSIAYPKNPAKMQRSRRFRDHVGRSGEQIREVDAPVRKAPPGGVKKIEKLSKKVIFNT